MNRLSIVSLLTLLVVYSGCIKSDGPDNKKRPERTVLVYFAADNNLAGFAYNDINEMTIGMAGLDLNKHKLLVYLDTGNEPELFHYKKDKEGRFIKESILKYPDQSSTDVDVMKTVFADAFKAYPADSYGLVLWSHAEGWVEAPQADLRWFGEDKKTYMNISDLKAALRTAPHFDYIYFDACYTASVELLYEIRECADYFIACPTETPGPGGPYDLLLPAMFKAKEEITAIGQLYYEYYNSLYKDGDGLSNDNWTAGASIAVIKSDELENLAQTTRQLLPNYVPNGDLLLDGVLTYDTRRNKYYYYDMAMILHSLTGDNDDYLQWKAAYDQAVIYFGTTDRNYSAHIPGMFTMKGATGLSLYVPRSSQKNILPYYKTYQWYKDGGWEAAGW